MDALTILQSARAAGLSVEAKGGMLVVRGPKALSGWVEILREHKAAVLAEIARSGLSREPGSHDSPPTRLTNAVEPKGVGDFLSTIAAQHCHPAVLAERLGMPLEDVLRRLEASPWSGHGARHRARLGLKASTGPPSTGDSARPAPPDHHLHFPAP